MALYSDIPSPSDKPQLTDEQLNDLVEGWRDGIAEGYKEIISLKYSSKPERMAQKIEDSLPELIAKDMEFARLVVKKFDEWSKEQDAVVLWDIDETMGKMYANNSNAGKYEWRLRPVFQEVVKYAQENYPNLTHGVLTTAPEAGIQSRLAELYTGGFLSHEHTYSVSNPQLTSHDRNSMEAFSRQQTGDEYITLSDGETAKLLVLTGLKGTGVNVKNIDDGRSALVWKEDGVCVYELQPFV